jgi:hypothetical protein
MYAGREEYSWQFDLRFQDAADSIISDLRVQEPGKNIVVCSSIPFISNRVHISSGAPILYNSGELNHPQNLRSAKPVIVLVILFKKDLPGYKDFLSYRGKKYLGDVEQYEFYALPIVPDVIGVAPE